MTDKQTDSPNPDDPAEALSQIHDDVAEKADAEQWAIDELLKGKTFEELTADLMEQGWDHNGAEQIVEGARVATRRERGVVTRDEIVGDLDREYRRATSGISMFLFGGLLGRAARTFFAAVRTVERLKRISKK